MRFYLCVLLLTLRAGGGNRTRVASLENWGSTIELRPRVVFCFVVLWCVPPAGFEPAIFGLEGRCLVRWATGANDERLFGCC